MTLQLAFCCRMASCVVVLQLDCYCKKHLVCAPCREHSLQHHVRCAARAGSDTRASAAKLSVDTHCPLPYCCKRSQLMHQLCATSCATEVLCLHLQVEEAAKVANCHDFISAFPQASMDPLVVVQRQWDHDDRY